MVMNIGIVPIGLIRVKKEVRQSKAKVVRSFILDIELYVPNNHSGIILSIYEFVG
jgi:hypothetical protein